MIYLQIQIITHQNKFNTIVLPNLSNLYYLYRKFKNLFLFSSKKTLMLVKGNQHMQSSNIKPTTSQILQKLQKKIEKYLSPSYAQTSDIFDKSSKIKRNHQQTITNNKIFFQSNERQLFQRQQQKNKSPEFDQLLSRRKKCQAKLNKMLFDHKFQEQLNAQSSTSAKQIRNSQRHFSSQFIISSPSTKENRISMNSIPLSEPNFLIIQKQLHKMQKKLSKIQKKVNSNKSNKKILTIKSVKNDQNYSKVSQFQRQKSLQLKRCIKSQDNLLLNKKLSLNKNLKNKDLISKNKQKVGIKSKQYIESKKRVQNSEQKQYHKNCAINNDQISLAIKFQQNKKQAVNLNSSKLKKIGISHFKQVQKRGLKNNKNDMVKQNKQNKSKNQPTVDQAKKPNRIKLNLIKCSSQQVL